MREKVKPNRGECRLKLFGIPLTGKIISTRNCELCTGEILKVSGIGRKIVSQQQQQRPFSLPGQATGIMLLNSICTICQESICGNQAFDGAEGIFPVTTKCGHLYHNNCIRGWFGSETCSAQNDGTPCPFCKEQVCPETGLIRVYPVMEMEDDGVAEPEDPESNQICLLSKRNDDLTEENQYLQDILKSTRRDNQFLRWQLQGLQVELAQVKTNEAVQISMVQHLQQILGATQQDNHVIRTQSKSLQDESTQFKLANILKKRIPESGRIGIPRKSSTSTPGNLQSCSATQGSTPPQAQSKVTPKDPTRDCDVSGRRDQQQRRGEGEEGSQCAKECSQCDRNRRAGRFPVPGQITRGHGNDEFDNGPTKNRTEQVSADRLHFRASRERERRRGTYDYGMSTDGKASYRKRCRKGEEYSGGQKSKNNVDRSRSRQTR